MHGGKAKLALPIGFCFKAMLVSLVTQSTFAARTIRLTDETAAGLKKHSAAEFTATVAASLESMKSGDALLLPVDRAFGKVSVANIANDVQIIGGKGESLEIGGTVSGLSIIGGDFDLRLAKQGGVLQNSYFVHTEGALDLGPTENSFWVDRKLKHGRRWIQKGR